MTMTYILMDMFLKIGSRSPERYLIWLRSSRLQNSKQRNSPLEIMMVYMFIGLPAPLLVRAGRATAHRVSSWFPMPLNMLPVSHWRLLSLKSLQKKLTMLSTDHAARKCDEPWLLTAASSVPGH